MPSASASQSILSANANYQADDWGSAAGNAQLDFRASTELKRGIDLEVGAVALVGLDASLSKFLSVDVQGRANAAAAVRAQIQVPLDLFDDAGLAIRLQAVAEAAVGIQLGIGLDVGDFMSLAAADPRMNGVALRLLKVFLDEAQIKGGVMAKAAVAAMAYVNVAATGRLIETRTGKPGFTIVGEAGVGLKAGAGYRMFAEFTLEDPQRLIRRSVDVVVDDTLERLAGHIDDHALRSAIDELRAPAKIALRTCFELGAELARGGGTFNAAQAPVVAQRCLQVFFEEAQRYLLETIVEVGLDLYTDALRGMGFSENAWNAAQPERTAFADRLRATSDDPFEPIPQNQKYWTDVIADASTLAIALGGQNVQGEPWVEPLAQVWAASQLLFVAVGRITDSGRATLINAAADASFPPFTGATPLRPPRVIRDRISATMRPDAALADPTLEDLVNYLMQSAVIDPLVQRHPAAKTLFEIVAGAGASNLATMRTLLTNLGPFIAQGGNRVDPQASLLAVMSGIQVWSQNRLRQNLEPALRDALGNAIPEVRLYLDEVLLASIGFAIDVVLPQAAQWAAGDALGHKALREACSALVMKILGSTLVVTTDVLLNKSLESVSSALRDAAPALNQPGGVVDKLDMLVPALDRATIKDAVTEIFELAAEVFEPLPPAKRARIRELLYDVIDTAPARPDAAFVDALKRDSLVPNAEAAIALAIELGTIIGENFTRLILKLLELLGNAILEALEALIAEIEHQITAWVASLQQLLQELGQLLVTVLAEIEELRDQLAAAADRLLHEADSFLGILASGNRSRMKEGLRRLVRDTCISVLNNISGYSYLPRDTRRAVKRVLDDVLDDVLDLELFDGLIDVFRSVAGEAQDFLQDARQIDPNDDVAGALIELLVDRIEDALRDEFGSRISIPIEIKLRGIIDFEFDFGNVCIDVDDAVKVVRQIARDLQAITSAAHDLGDRLTDYLVLEQLLDAREVEEANARAWRDDTRRRVRESQVTGSVRVVQPGASAAYAGDVPVEIALTNVPRSVLGLHEDEAAGLIVCLDEMRLDLSRFDIVDRAERPPTPTRGIIGGNIATSVAAPSGWELGAIGRLTGSFRESHPLLRGRAQQSVGRRAQTWHRAETGATTRARLLEGAKTAIGRSVQIGGQPLTASVGDTPTLGRRPRPSISDQLIEESGANLILRGTLLASELPEGFHTLTVMLTTGRKSMRQSEAVVFHASPSAALKRPPLATRPLVGALPVRPSLVIDDLAPALREVAARGGGRTARIGPPKKAAPLSRARLASPAVTHAVEAHRKVVTDRFQQLIDRVEVIRQRVVQRPLAQASAALGKPIRVDEKEDYI